MRSNAFLVPVPLLAVALLAPASRAQCWDETATLAASNGFFQDRYGEAATLSGDTAVVGASGWNEMGLNSAGTAYVIERNAGGPGVWGQVKQLTASDAHALGLFGRDVALDADTLVVGAPDATIGAVGAAYVFERDAGGPGNWGETHILVPPGLLASDGYGASVAVAGDTLAVTAEYDGTAGFSAGAIHVFERDLGGPGNWGLARKITGAASIRLGTSLEFSGDTLAVGAVGDQTFGVLGGAAFLFERDLGGPGAWGQAAKVLAAGGSAGDRFGTKLSLDTGTLVVGAPGNDHDDDCDAGAAYVFERDLGGPGAWGQRRKLTAPDGVPDDAFGFGVSLFGDTIVVGAAGNDDNGNDSGSAYVFERGLAAPVGWGHAKKLLPSVGAKFEGFGVSVKMDGGTFLIGAPSGFVAGVRTGWVRVFEPAVAAAVSYCTAGVSAISCRPFLTACGSPSATSASGFTLQAGDVEGFRDGILYFGTSGRQARPWGTGSFQCVRPPLQRTGLLSGVGNGAPGWCDGAFELDLNAYWCASCPKPQHNPGAGTTLQAQLWIRDPLNPPAGSVTSNAVEFTAGP